MTLTFQNFLLKELAEVALLLMFTDYNNHEDDEECRGWKQHKITNNHEN